MFPYIKPKKLISQYQKRMSESNILGGGLSNILECLAQFTKKMQEVNIINVQMSKYLFDIVGRGQQGPKSQSDIKLPPITIRSSQKKEHDRHFSEPITPRQNEQIMGTTIRHVSKQQQAQNNERLQMRYQYINVPLPENQIEKMDWIGKMCKQVFSIGFNLYKTGQFDESTVRVYCSENIIRNLINFSQKYPLSQIHVKQINKCLQKQLLPYFLLKYPQSQQLEVNNKFSKQLIERDILEENQYDYVYKSCVKFSYEESGNYDSQIMQMLNYIIQLPNKSTEATFILDQGFQEDSHSGNNSISKQFIDEMSNLFQMIEDEEKTINMLKFDPKNSKLSEGITQIIKINQTGKVFSQRQKQQYKQKVRSYSTYAIGQKLSTNFRSYSEYEINSGNLKLKKSTMMRIVTKWSSQLQKYFEPQNILHRQTPFRMKNGQEKYLESKQIKLLNYLLQRQKVIINEKLKNIFQNNYKHQSQLFGQEVTDRLKKLSIEEALVGQFSSIVFKNNENYLISYINLLIHGICKASLDFEKFQYFSKFVPQKPMHISQFDRSSSQKISQSYLSQFASKLDKITLPARDKCLQYVPQLISFRIGDLLRCKCISKESEIIALYREVERRSKVSPEEIKILRVKNRLDKGNKDILMNILFKNTMIVQMQLAIKQQKSKFVQFSNKFNHYLYELKRAKFGPLTEMCNIWISEDFRSQFYLDSLEETNIRKKITDMAERQKIREKLETECLKNHQINTMPFKCQYCQYFYFDSSSDEKHIFCKSCKMYTCFLCQFEMAKDEKREKILPTMKFNKQIQDRKIHFYFNEIPSQGVIINLKSKKRQPLLFQALFENNEFYLFHYRKNEEKQRIQLIDRLKKREINNYCKQNIIYTIDFLISRLIQSNKQRSQFLISKYFIGNYLRQCYKTQNTSLSLISKSLTEEKMEVDDVDFWPEIKKLNFSENEGLQSLDKSVSKFPNIQLGIFNKSGLKKLPEVFWKNLRYLQLKKNNLKNIDSVMQSRLLVEINASDNKIVHLPENIGDLSLLEKLDVSCNHIQDIPSSIGKLKELWKLNLKSNSIEILPQEFSCLQKLSDLNIYGLLDLKNLPPNIGNLKKLKSIVFSSQQIKQLPQTFPQLSSLQYLQMNSCIKMQRLPHNFDILSSLKQICFSYCFLQELPDNFGKLNQLEKLDINMTGFKSLPDSFPSLSQLRILQISNCSILELPNNFGKLANLETFNLQSLKIKSLPESFGELKKLKNLSILYCTDFQSLSESFGDLPSLQNLQIRSTAIKNLPKNFCQLRLLKKFQISYTPIQSFPQQISSLKNLEQLFACGLTIQQIPSSLGRCSSLKRLELLACKNIMSLPFNLLNLQMLQTLRLYECSSLKMPEFFFNIQTLKKVSIQKCEKMKKIYEGMASLKVQELILDIEIQQEIPTFIWTLENLKNLKIRVNREVKLQESVLQAIYKKNVTIKIVYSKQQKSFAQALQRQLTSFDIKAVADPF